MEEFSNRFPALIPMILKNVDDQSLVKFKETSREMSEIIVNERFYWIRILKKYNQNFEEFSNAWKLVIEKTSVAMVQKLALDVQKFFSYTYNGKRHDNRGRLEKQWSPLHIAAVTRDLDLLKHIVVKTEDVNHESENCSNDYTALHLAAEKGSLTACIFIINWSLYRGGKDRQGRTPIDTAAIHMKWEVCEYLLENSDGFPMGNFKIPLWLAAYYHQTEIYKLFFEHTRARNLPFNPPNSSDLETPLHQAAQHGNLEICKLIIGETQDIGQKTHLMGYTPLHDAAGYSNPIRLEIFKLIFDNVQDKEPKDNKGRTPLHHAAKYGNLEVCKLIIGEIENKNPMDSAGWTPLHCAAQNGHEEICDLISSQVVDKNPRACDGTTPEFLMRRYRLFSEDFESISPRVERREQAQWNGFEEIKLNNGNNTVWWARTPNKTHFY
jgi:ankyrin repeat protein